MVDVAFLSHLNLRDLEGAERLFHLMREHGVQPDDCTYNFIIMTCRNASEWGRGVRREVEGWNKCEEEVGGDEGGGGIKVMRVSDGDDGVGAGGG